MTLPTGSQSNYLAMAFRANLEKDPKAFTINDEDIANIAKQQAARRAVEEKTKPTTPAKVELILAQGSMGKALEEATAKALASLASQALVKSLFYTAEGFAALAGFEESSASQYFIAAGEMAAVGAAAGVAARSMAGGGGGSNTPSQFQNNNGGTNTTGSGHSGSSVVGVQHFAEGGLITAPTLAMIGEQSRTEAVLPLEDPRAMQAIGESIGAGGGGGVHIHLPHGSIISADTMQKFVAKMNKMVGRGQLNVKSSNSLRINKRSA